VRRPSLIEQNVGDGVELSPSGADVVEDQDSLNWTSQWAWPDGWLPIA